MCSTLPFSISLFFFASSPPFWLLLLDSVLHVRCKRLFSSRVTCSDCDFCRVAPLETLFMSFRCYTVASLRDQLEKACRDRGVGGNEQAIFRVLFSCLCDRLPELCFYKVMHRDGTTSLGLDEPSMQRVLSSASTDPLFDSGATMLGHFVPRPLSSSAYVNVSSEYETFTDPAVFQRRWSACHKNNKKIMKLQRQNHAAQQTQQMLDTLKHEMFHTRLGQSMTLFSLDFESESSREHLCALLSLLSGQCELMFFFSLRG